MAPMSRCRPKGSVPCTGREQEKPVCTFQADQLDLLCDESCRMAISASQDSCKLLQNLSEADLQVTSHSKEKINPFLVLSLILFNYVLL